MISKTNTLRHNLVTPVEIPVIGEAPVVGLPGGASSYRYIQPRASVTVVPATEVAPAGPRPRGKVVVVRAPEPVQVAAQPRALLVTHGMGQQIEFQTLDAVEQGLRRSEQKLAGVPVAMQQPAATQVVEIGGEKMVRLALQLTNPVTKSSRSVHLYEAYWAPLTEGNVTLRDVVSFLFRGAVHGTRNALPLFERWVFGGLRDFGPQWRAFFELWIALFVLLSLIALNAIVTGLAGALAVQQAVTRLLPPHLGTGWPNWIHSALVGDMHRILVFVILIPVGLASALMYLGRSMLGLWLALAAVLASGATAVWLVGRHLWGFTGSAFGSGPAPLWFDWLFLLWAVLLALSARVRGLMVQYVGDVALYVSPDYLDRFHQLRMKIKSMVGSRAEAIYAAALPTGQPLYDGVVLTGHSLGSVISYDVLNALIIDDKLRSARRRLDVLGRTRALVTFGSPLNKTAFIFGRERRETTEVREALAATVQPLINDYANRTFPWINVRSPKDIISGDLRQFYDDPAGPRAGCGIDDVIDPQCRIPVAAHTEYWNNDAVFDRLHAALVAEP